VCTVLVGRLADCPGRPDLLLEARCPKARGRFGGRDRDSVVPFCIRIRCDRRSECCAALDRVGRISHAPVMTESPPVLDARDLTVGYDVTPIVRSVDLSLQCGEWCALIGPNGCGKSTLLNTIAGRLTPLSGVLHIAGHSIQDAPTRAKSCLGYALPPDALPERLTLRECLRLFTRLHGRQSPAPLVEELIGPWSLRNRLDDSIDQSSLGTRQKLGILLAFVGAPSLVLLDESFNALDPRSALILEEVLEAQVKARELGVMLATHALEMVRRHASLAVLIDNGRVAARLARDELDDIGDGLREELAARQLRD
jgi:ABC-2 type transport system ATP-binding protein